MTLEELAASDDRAARGAAALIKAGYAEGTRAAQLSPGSVTRTLAEVLARELAQVYEQLDQTYERFRRHGDGRQPRGARRQPVPAPPVVVAASAVVVELVRS